MRRKKDSGGQRLRETCRGEFKYLKRVGTGTDGKLVQRKQTGPNNLVGFRRNTYRLKLFMPDFRLRSSYDKKL